MAAADRVYDHMNRAKRAVALIVGRVVADDILRAQVFGVAEDRATNNINSMAERKLLNSLRLDLRRLLNSSWPVVAVVLSAPRPANGPGMADAL